LRPAGARRFACGPFFAGAVAASAWATAVMLTASRPLVRREPWKVFWRALESGQFDDLERPAHHILADDDRPK
jgi:hypothetical protein